MAIGTLGPITFNASTDKVQTFEEYTLDKSSRIAIHENLQNKPIVEFIGPGLDKINLKLTWSIEGKINPLAEISKLEEKQEKGEVIIFFLGGKPVGKGKYIIENISRANKRVDNKGILLSISFNISLIEYAENARKETKLVTTNIASTSTKKKAPNNSVKKKAITKRNEVSVVYKPKNNEVPMPKIGTRLTDLIQDLNSYSPPGGDGAGGGGAGGF